MPISKSCEAAGSHSEQKLHFLRNAENPRGSRHLASPLPHPGAREAEWAFLQLTGLNRARVFAAFHIIPYPGQTTAEFQWGCQPLAVEFERNSSPDVVSTGSRAGRPIVYKQRHARHGRRSAAWPSLHPHHRETAARSPSAR
jgi:hypothetical protein